MAEARRESVLHHTSSGEWAVTTSRAFPLRAIVEHLAGLPAALSLQDLDDLETVRRRAEDLLDEIRMEEQRVREADRQ